MKAIEPQLVPLTPKDYLLWVADQIEKEPESYDQNYWYHHLWADAPDGAGHDTPAVFSCASSCCIAGWVAAKADAEGQLTVFEKYNVDAETIAQNILELPFYKAKTLFSGVPDEVWPEPYCNQWDDSYLLDHFEKKKAQAEIASRFLRDIANGAVELS